MKKTNKRNCEDCIYDKKMLCIHSRGSINRLAGYTGCVYFTSKKMNKIMLCIVIAVILIYIVSLVFMLQGAKFE